MLPSHRDLLVFYPTCHTEGSGEHRIRAELLNCILGWIEGNVKSTHPLADRRSGVGFIGAELRCQLTAGLQGGVVDGLKDVDVEQLGLGAFKGITHQDEGISQTLHTDSNWSVALVRPLRLQTSTEEPLVTMEHIRLHSG